jgi:RimJ/RimL family protein N-acetyltransferase
MLIHTDRCLIRPFKESDIDEFMTYRNDMLWMQYQGFKGLNKQEYLALLSRACLREGVQLAIICNETNVLIGDIYIKEEDSAHWIGCTIKPAKARQGYAFETISAVIIMLKNKGVTYIKAGAATGNTASIALLEKLNFQYLETCNDEMIYSFHHLTNEVLGA